MHIVSGKIRKAPFIKEGCGPDGQSKMYIVELSEMTKDWQTQEKSYANFKAVFFAKTDGAKSFYDQAFAEGSFIVVAAEKLKVDTFDADSGKTYVTLNMENARLESCMPLNDQGQGQSQPQQNNYQQQATTPQQQPSPQMAPPQQAPRPTPTHAPQQTPAQKRAQQSQINEPSMGFNDNEVPF